MFPNYNIATTQQQTVLERGKTMDCRVGGRRGARVIRQIAGLLFAQRLLVAIVVLTLSGAVAVGTSAQSIPVPLDARQLPPRIAQVQGKPLPLAHLYYYFLLHQNALDSKAASEDAKGRDGSWLRNHHQVNLGFSDSDYAVIRTSSRRLAAEIKELDAQVAAMRSSGPSAANSAQLKTIIAEREAYINAEVAYLKKELSADKITAFERYAFG